VWIGVHPGRAMKRIRGRASHMCASGSLSLVNRRCTGSGDRAAWRNLSVGDEVHGERERHKRPREVQPDTEGEGRMIGSQPGCLRFRSSSWSPLNCAAAMMSATRGGWCSYRRNQRPAHDSDGTAASRSIFTQGLYGRLSGHLSVS
jgi:hypothetical protein